MFSKVDKVGVFKRDFSKNTEKFGIIKCAGQADLGTKNDAIVYIDVVVIQSKVARKTLTPI
jgi:hypothetical protein